MLDSEITFFKKASHPNLLRCHNNYTTLNNHYIITEYCNEGDLASQLKRKGRFSEEQFTGVFLQVLAGYSKINEMGYIHRDLKPANILLKDNTIKIADFGFVKECITAVREKYNVGTPLYMSPEAMKSNIYTPKNDIWSLGVLSYELLAGTPPWNCKNEQDLKEKVQQNNIRFDNMCVSLDLKDLIMRMLEIDEFKRISLHQIMSHSWYRRVSNKQPPISKTPTLNYLNVPKANSNPAPAKNNGLQEFLIHVNNQDNLPKGDARVSLDTAANTNYKKNSKLSILEILTSLLHFCRLNNKIQKLLRKLSLPAIKISELIGLFQLELIKQIQFHEKIISSKENLVLVGGWREFLTSKEWERYQSVVQQYSTQYRNTTNLYDKENTPVNKDFKFGLVMFIRQINSAIQMSKQSYGDKHHADNAVLCLDYLVTYYQLYDLYQFHMETRNYESFALESRLEEIMSNGIGEKKNIDRDLYRRVCEKIEKLQLNQPHAIF